MISEKINNFFSRIIPVFTAAVVLIVSLSAPARAASYQDDSYIPFDGFYNSPSGSVTYLSDLDWVESVNIRNLEATRDYVWNSVAPIWLGGKAGGSVRNDGGVLFSKGLGVCPGDADHGIHGTCYTIFDLASLDVDTFYSVVGITNQKGQYYLLGNITADGYEYYGNGLYFRVYGDYGDGSYVLLSESEHIKQTATGEFKVDVRGVKYLKLVVDTAGAWPGANWSLDCAWANACVYNSTSASHILDYIGNRFNTIVAWLGMMISELVSPEGSFYGLLPFVGVAVAITAVLLIAKLVRHIIWSRST